MAEVVVGIDGSQQSYAALRLAAAEARCRSARLHVVYVYEPARTAAAASAAAAVVAAGTWSSPPGDESFLRGAQERDEREHAEARRQAEGRLRQLVKQAGVDLAGLDVEQSAIGDARPAAALVRMTQGADLLVVGSRGLGGFAGLLLGSVGQQCVNHAACPVLVVRG